MDSITLPIILVDECDRRVLNEGRNREIGYAFCKREGSVFTCLHPISACKDYLNDIAWTEITGMSMTAYGITTKKHGLFVDRAYLAMKILKEGHKAQIEYGGYHEDIAKLEANYKRMEKFINWFEDKRGVPHTEILRAGDNQFVVSFDLFWVKYTYMISIYSLLVRLGLHWNGVQDPIEYITNIKSEESYMMAVVRPKILRVIIDGEMPHIDPMQISDVHNHGIFFLNFPPKPTQQL